MSEPAIACSLEGTEQTKRLEEISDLAGRALLEVRQSEVGLRLRFARRPGIRHELERLVEAESLCCSFLRFDLDSSGRGFVLDISGPHEARALMAEMFGFSTRGIEAR